MRLKSDLRRAQDAVATHLYENDAVQAIVPMGGGKTAAALTAIRELIDDDVIRAALVLAPKRVAQLVWTKEHKLWEHLQHTKIVHVVGTPAQRLKLLQEPAEVYVVGVDNTQWLVDTLQKDVKLRARFKLLLIDELSRFKNPRGKRVKALDRLVDSFDIIWGLTGTPRPNGYEDQFRPIKLITKKKVWRASFDKWREKHFIRDDPFDPHTKWTVRPEHETRIIKTIAAYSITIGDEDMPDLDPITNVFHWVELPPKVRAYYKDMERELLAKTDDGNVLAASQAVATGKLAQIAQGFMYDEDGGVIHLHTEKADMLVDLAEAADEEPVLISYEFKEDLRVLQSLYPGIPYFGAGVKDAVALDQEARWNRRELPIMALHPASAGHGLNLQYGGRQFIFYAMTWSAELYDQVLKRVHRPGQTERVFAHHILARDTVDQIKYDRVVGKMTEQEAFRKYIRSL